ncbi:uncharacterized protein LOC143028431 [Oratosquilla oratoria]|uniref:uncharacterized protein LOC143028431 n=1 Tax=Oratosquilla oratoria TaxID=337810 RepID=UPI003F7590FB
MKVHLYTGCLALCFLFVRAQIAQTTTAAPEAHPQQEGDATASSGTGGVVSGVDAEPGDPTQGSPGTSHPLATSTTTPSVQRVPETTPSPPSHEDGQEAFESSGEATLDGLPAQDDNETAAAGEDLTASSIPPPGHSTPQAQITGTSATTPTGLSSFSTTGIPEHQQVTPAPSTGEGAGTSELFSSTGGPATTTQEDSGAESQHSTIAPEHGPTSDNQPAATSASYYSTETPSSQQETTTVTMSTVGASEVVQGANITQVVCHWSAAELAYCLAVLAVLSLIQMSLLTLCVYRVVSRSHTWEPPPIHYSKNPRREARGGRGLHLASDRDCKSGESTAADQNGGKRADGGADGGGGQRSSDIPILITNEDGWCVPYGDAQDRKSLRKKTQDTGL